MCGQDGHTKHCERRSCRYAFQISAILCRLGRQFLLRVTQYSDSADRHAVVRDGGAFVRPLKICRFVFDLRAGVRSFTSTCFTLYAGHPVCSHWDRCGSKVCGPGTRLFCWPAASRAFTRADSAWFWRFQLTNDAGVVGLWRAGDDGTLATGGGPLPRSFATAERASPKLDMAITEV